MKIKFIIPFIIVLLSVKPVDAQKLNYKISENANRMFLLENYKRAKELYRELYKKNYNNYRNKFRFGVCLVYTYERKDALSLLNSTKTFPGTPKEVWFHIAKAYHLDNKFEQAISHYETFINTDYPNYQLTLRAKRNIEMCNNAKKLMQDSIEVEFVALGDEINTEYDEYLPFITSKADLLIFSTRRLGTTGRVYDLESYFTADIYSSKFKYGKWSKAKTIGPPNSYGNEDCAGMSENGKYIFYHVNNPKSKNNLQLSEKGKSTYGRSVEIESKEINMKSNKQISATMSNDGNYMIFSSDRKDGYGGSDLYISKKIKNKKDSTKTEWSEPINLGDKINTPYDDSYPYLVNNGKTLLFASKGHNSMGGYDIFYTSFDIDNLTSETPKNIGYPINDTDDNTNICFTSDPKIAFISTFRKEGKGNLDIYKLIFKNPLPFLSNE